ncbi:MAG: hypothetical protein ACRCUY_00815 [Thermoguttaceae bacterium]
MNYIRSSFLKRSCFLCVHFLFAFFVASQSIFAQDPFSNISFDAGPDVSMSTPNSPARPAPSLNTAISPVPPPTTTPPLFSPSMQPVPAPVSTGATATPTSDALSIPRSSAGNASQTPFLPASAATLGERTQTGTTTNPAFGAESIRPTNNAATSTENRPESRQIPQRIGVSAANTAHTNAVEPTPKQLREQPELLRSIMPTNHPFATYYTVPQDADDVIHGKAFSIAELLEGVGNPQLQKQLIDIYWELAGLLVEYNVRYESERNLAQWYSESERSRDPRSELLGYSVHLAQQQRKGAECRFVMKQRQLADRLQKISGLTFSEKTLPIPSDVPLIKKYETHAKMIAKSDRAKYVAQMIPMQEKFLETLQTANVAARLFLESTLKISSQKSPETVFALNQHTGTFVDLIAGVVDYNKMIAEYSLETVGPGISSYQLLSTLLELPKHNPKKDAAIQSTSLTEPNEMPVSIMASEPRQLPPAPQPTFAAVSYKEENFFPSNTGISIEESIPNPIQPAAWNLPTEPAESIIKSENGDSVAKNAPNKQFFLEEDRLQKDSEE